MRTNEELDRIYLMLSLPLQVKMKMHPKFKGCYLNQGIDYNHNLVFESEKYKLILAKEIFEEEEGSLVMQKINDFINNHENFEEIKKQVRI